jgi:hypothetical protein
MSKAQTKLWKGKNQWEFGLKTEVLLCGSDFVKKLGSKVIAESEGYLLRAKGKDTLAGK